MCGLVGLIARSSTGFTNTSIDVFKQMLHLDQIRGEDATGVFTTTTNNDVLMVKQAAPPFVFNQSAYTVELYAEAVKSGRILIGHNRKATSGDTNSDAAHPFIEDGTIMVHNGFLSNHKSYFDTSVDSHALAKLLSQHKTVEGYRSVFDEVEGAFAVIWYNGHTGNLHVFRNNQRPLNFIECKEGIILASEPWMVEYAKSKSSLFTGKVEEFKAGYVYTVDFWGTLSQDSKYTGKTTYSSYHGYEGYYETVTPSSNLPVPSTSKGGNTGKKPETTGTSAAIDKAIDDKVNNYAILRENGLKIGDSILFEVHHVTKTNVTTTANYAYWNLHGLAWIPEITGGITASAILKLDDTKESEELVKGHILQTYTGRITGASNNSPTTDENKIYLKELQVSQPLKEMDWAGRNITEQEFEWLQGSKTCLICDSVLNLTQSELKDVLLYHPAQHPVIDKASNEHVYLGDVGQYVYVCKECLGKYVDGKEMKHEHVEIVDQAVSGELNLLQEAA